MIPHPSADGDVAAFRRALQTRLDAELDAAEARARSISPEAAALVSSVAALSTGGKRLRATLAWIGWRAAGGDPGDPRILTAGAAIELFQAAALIHDDILDRSDTRRGMPSVHRRFEALHRERDWRHEPEHFGVCAAILAGDTALALSDTAFAEAIAGSARPEAARAEMQTMRFEVMAGQYLDVLAETQPPAGDPDEAAARAARVVEYKSARYTTVHPAALGVLLAGGDDALVDAFAAVTLPFGLAFQYQDDLLGIFGDAEVTGKPSGDDLREGKRTVLIAHAHRLLAPADVVALEQDLGRADLSAEAVAGWQGRFEAAGVRERLDADIHEHHDQARGALAELTRRGAAQDAVQALAGLMDSLLGRSA